MTAAGDTCYGKVHPFFVLLDSQLEKLYTFLTSTLHFE